MKHKIVGQGEIIIILRGLGRSFEYWLDFETELAKYFRVVMINMPGIDDEKERTPITTKGNADRVVEKIRLLKNEIGEPPYHIFGISLGGLTAMGIAYYYPELVSTLTAASSSIMQFQKRRINLVPFLKLMMMQLEPGEVSYPNRRIGKYLVSRQFRKENPDIIERWDDLWYREELTKPNFFRQLLSALFSLTPRMVNKIKVPTLLISGEKDALVPFENSEIISGNIPNSVHIPIPDIGHDVTTERPEFIAQIISVLAKTKSPSLIGENYRFTKEPTEITRLKRIEKRFPDFIILEELGGIKHNGFKVPMHAFFIGHKPDPKLPTVAFFSCFHGVEWIGGRVLLNYVEHLVRSMCWDEGIRDLISKMNICGIPVVNPVGRIEKTRSNGNGIDLMRNTSVTGERVFPLLGGHHLSKSLPWYRGEKIEKENKITMKFLDDHVFPSDFKITMDIHSTFMRRSRIWIPYASGKKLPEKEADVFAKIKKLLNSTYKYNPYRYEKQDLIYRTHGDFWDFNFDRHKSDKKGLYLPMTLEISTAEWLFRNFITSWTFESLFNPSSRRESNQEYFRHITVFDFILRFAKNYKDTDRE
ncbi:MAG: alpha/beta fold hydrolase [Pseudomonadota bacterium]